MSKQPYLIWKRNDVKMAEVSAHMFRGTPEGISEVVVFDDEDNILEFLLEQAKADREEGK